MNPEGMALPSPQDLPKLEKQELIDLIVRQSQQLVRERQDSSKRLIESQAKCKAEMDRLRQTTHQHGQDLQNQNSALLQSLGRMKAENDELQRKVILLEARQEGVPRVPAQPADQSTAIPVSTQAPSLSGESIPMPPMRSGA